MSLSELHIKVFINISMLESTIDKTFLCDRFKTLHGRNILILPGVPRYWYYTYGEEIVCFLLESHKLLCYRQ